MKKINFIITMTLIMASNILWAQYVPQLVKNINKSSNHDGNAYPACLSPVNFELYFGANDGTTTSFYKTDGTEAGTLLVKEGLRMWYKGFKFNNLLYFPGQQDQNYGLWRSDGTSSGTYRIKKFEYFIEESFYVLGEKFYFYGCESGYDDVELWVSDGTAAGTVRVKDIWPGTTNSGIHSYNRKLVEMNGKLYFAANDGLHGIELWVTDGTEAGTQMVKDIYVGNNSSISVYGNLEVLNNKLYFAANDGIHGMEIWRTDGTAAGTELFIDINAGKANGVGDLANYFFKVNFSIEYKLVFRADNGVNGYEPWITDGTVAGTYMLKDINPGSEGSGRWDGYSFVTWNMFNFYFSAYNPDSGWELWKTNGTEKGTVMIKDIVPGATSGLDPTEKFNVLSYHNKVYFFATPTGAGSHLYVTDGSSEGTVMLLPASLKNPDPVPEFLTNVNERTLYFRANYNTDTGIELYKIEIPYQVTTFATPATGGVATGAGSYLVGDKVTLTALPVANFEFANWTNSSGTVVSTSAAYTITMPGRNVTYTANFRSTINRNLTLTASPAAGGTVKGGGSYPSGTWVTIEASPNSGYEFVNWTEGTSIISTNTEYSFSLEKDRNLTANFKQSTVKYTISLSSNPALGGSTSGGGSYVSGSSVTVTATPGKGYEFVNWTERGNEVSQSASYKFTVTRNRSLVANFQATGIKKYTLSLLTIPVEGGNVSGGGTYTTGTTVTASATPNKGYQFVNWTENDSEVSTDANFTFNLNANRSLTANFVVMSGVNAPSSYPVFLYPNPASNILKIDGIREKTSVKFYNISGVEVLNEVIDSSTYINITSLIKGLYFVVLESDLTKHTFRIVKN